MKNILYLFLIGFALQSCTKESFTLKTPDVGKIKETIDEVNYLRGGILIYLENNYSNNSKKINVKKESDEKTECGFTQKFQFDIQYSIEQCNEVTFLTEKVIFPKTELSSIKKWVEQIYKAGLTDIENTWYENENKYGPKDREAGCYYTIKQTETHSIIKVWCGS